MGLEATSAAASLDLTPLNICVQVYEEQWSEEYDSLNNNAPIDKLKNVSHIYFQKISEKFQNLTLTDIFFSLSFFLSLALYQNQIEFYDRGLDDYLQRKKKEKHALKQKHIHVTCCGDGMANEKSIIFCFEG